MTTFVIVPGIDGSGPDHWQTRWQADLPAVRFEPSSWSEPDLDDWQAALDAAVSSVDDAVLVTHSLGCLAAAAWLLDHPGRVSGAFLVAPPDPDGPQFPRAAPSFVRGYPGPLPSPALVVASANDPYCTLAAARRQGRTWRAGLVVTGDDGHLNADSGLGAWPTGRSLLAAFCAGLGVGMPTSPAQDAQR